MFTKTVIAATALSTMMLAAQPALAHDTVSVSQQVRYADLDLSTPEGQARLDARLRHAASAVCDFTSGPRPLSEATEARRCYNDALKSARQSYAALATRKAYSR